MSAVIAIVLLQHGRWQDTVACLQSLVPAVNDGLARVIVVDNGSPDNSAERVASWLGGALPPAARPADDVLADLWWPLEGSRGAVWDPAADDQPAGAAMAPWTLFRNIRNDGFAGGMNIGVRCALADPDVDAVWLLNNDTVVARSTVKAIRTALDAAPPDVGQFGTTTCYYAEPTIVQSVGWCRWNAWLATSSRTHDGAQVSGVLSRETPHPGYVYGASWVIRARALRDVGLLSEDGFLYGEELDWACRAERVWGSRLIPEAVVWHREGATVGAGATTIAARSELADLCGISARLRLTRRFFPRRLPIVYSSLLGAALNRLRRGDARRALAVARLVIAGGLPVPRPVSNAGQSSSSRQ